MYVCMYVYIYYTYIFFILKKKKYLHAHMGNRMLIYAAESPYNSIKRRAPYHNIS